MMARGLVPGIATGAPSFRTWRGPKTPSSTAKRVVTRPSSVGRFNTRSRSSKGVREAVGSRPRADGIRVVDYAHPRRSADPDEPKVDQAASEVESWAVHLTKRRAPAITQI
jgi:hypothetical protein